jgi:hypothetical protein
MPFGIALLVLLLVLIFSTLRVLNEYERGVMFTLGRFTGIKGPGVVFVFPVVQQMRKVDLRLIVLNVPKQDVITRDNVSVKVNAVVYFRIVDPGKAIIQVATPARRHQPGRADHAALGGRPARDGRPLSQRASSTSTCSASSTRTRVPGHQGVHGGVRASTSTRA